jgi:hypothetical protein
MTGHVDFTALWQAAVAAEAQLRVADPATVRKAWERDLGLDVATDLAAHIADDVMLLWQATAPEHKDYSLLGNLWHRGAGCATSRQPSPDSGRSCRNWASMRRPRMACSWQKRQACCGFPRSASASPTASHASPLAAMPGSGCWP